MRPREEQQAGPTVSRAREPRSSVQSPQEPPACSAPPGGLSGCAWALAFQTGVSGTQKLLLSV